MTVPLVAGKDYSGVLTGISLIGCATVNDSVFAFALLQLTDSKGAVTVQLSATTCYKGVWQLLWANLGHPAAGISIENTRQGTVVASGAMLSVFVCGSDGHLWWKCWDGKKWLDWVKCDAAGPVLPLNSVDHASSTMVFVADAKGQAWVLKAAGTQWVAIQAPPSVLVNMMGGPLIFAMAEAYYCILSIAGLQLSATLFAVPVPTPPAGTDVPASGSSSTPAAVSAGAQAPAQTNTASADASATPVQKLIIISGDGQPLTSVTAGSSRTYQPLKVRLTSQPSTGLAQGQSATPFSGKEILWVGSGVGDGNIDHSLTDEDGVASLGGTSSMFPALGNSQPAIVAVHAFDVTPDPLVVRFYLNPSAATVLRGGFKQHGPPFKQLKVTLTGVSSQALQTVVWELVGSSGVTDVSQVASNYIAILDPANSEIFRWLGASQSSSFTIRARSNGRTTDFIFNPAPPAPPPPPPSWKLLSPINSPSTLDPNRSKGPLPASPTSPASPIKLVAQITDGTGKAIANQTVQFALKNIEPLFLNISLNGGVSSFSMPTGDTGEVTCMLNATINLHFASDYPGLKIPTFQAGDLTVSLQSDPSIALQFNFLSEW